MEGGEGREEMEGGHGGRWREREVRGGRKGGREGVNWSANNTLGL